MRRWGLIALVLLGCDDGGEAPVGWEEWDLPRMIGDALPLDQGPADAAPEAGPLDRGAPDAGDLDQSVADAGMDAAMPLDMRIEPDAAPDMAPDMAPPPPPGSDGCGQPEVHRRGGEWVSEMAFGDAAGGTRGFYLTVPQRYDANRPHALIIGYPGTDWLGGQIRDYLRLEDGRRTDEIFVYPDPLWRDFGNWGVRGGWQLGPDGWNAEGMEDLVFTEALIEHLSANYCINPERIFVTGHSWGGDMAHVVSCFLGDRVRAAAPAAANRPFWFAGVDECPGDPAIWTFFGVADDHFNLADPGSYGAECRDFWLEENDCDGVDAHVPIDLGPEEQCFAYAGCVSETRYCLYGPASRHQIPPYFSAEVMRFFRSFGP